MMNVNDYADLVYSYWQMEYDNYIGDNASDLLISPVLKMIITDCCKLNIKPNNCCSIIHNSFFSLDSSKLNW
jgi:hypothetical protein